MERFLYLFVKNWLDAENVDYEHYELFNQQPTDLSISNPYPAIYLEILPIEWSSISLGVQEADLQFRLHIVNEIFSSFDADDKDIDKSLAHLEFNTSVFKALNRKSTDDPRTPIIIKNQQDYEINTISRIRTIQNVNVKSRYITMMDFSAKISDYSNYNYNTYIDFTLESITGTTNSSTSQTWEIGGSF